MWGLEKVQYNSNLVFQTRMKIIENSTLPVRSYKTQMWSITKSEADKSGITRSEMETRILEITRLSQELEITKTCKEDVVWTLKDMIDGAREQLVG